MRALEKDPERPLPGRRRVHRRAAGRADAPDGRAARYAVGRAGGRRRGGGARRAAGGCGCSRCSRSPRSPSALYLLLRPSRPRSPTWSASARATPPQILQNRGFEVDIQRVVNAAGARATTSRRRTRSRASRPTRARRSRLIVSAGPGDGDGPAGHGHVAGQGGEGAQEPPASRSDARRRYSDDVKSGQVISDQPAGGLDGREGQHGDACVSRGRAAGRGARRGRQDRSPRRAG